MMELVGEMDGYRSQHIFKTKNKATLQKIHVRLQQKKLRAK